MSTENGIVEGVSLTWIDYEPRRIEDPLGYNFPTPQHEYGISEARKALAVLAIIPIIVLAVSVVGLGVAFLVGIVEGWLP
jgi:hypothetical protein